MDGPDLASLPLDRLEHWFVDQGEKAFRARQLFRWLHGRSAASYDEMTDLAKGLRARLAEQAPLRAPTIEDELVSADGTRKFRFGLADGLQVEGVWMPAERRSTLCVSTQVGCAMRCAFCATGTLGLKRDLSAGEIVGQVEAVNRQLRSDELPRPVSNVVFMGMGEPLANLDATVDAVQILLSEQGHLMSRRHVTVSTIGLVPAMGSFVQRAPVKLAVSLNAASDEVRDRLMPVNRRYPIDRLLAACRDLPLRGTNRVTFEYVMLAGVNDGLADARLLAKRLGGLRCKINLIPYNPAEGLPFERPEDDQVHAFQETLAAKGLSVFVRQSRGQDLRAACGQLIAGRGGG